MAKLKVPSLQHLARMWRPDPSDIKRHLVGLTQHGPTFSYEPIYTLVRDMLVYKVPYDQTVECVRRAAKREDVRKNYLSLLPLIRSHFSSVSPSFVQAVATRFYPVGRELMVRFSPPLIYGVDGSIHFPWFSFWKSNPLEGERLSLFVTIVEEILLQDSDLDEAVFQILDFSAPKGEAVRELTVIDTSKVPRLSASRKAEMLSIFAEGFRLASSEPLSAGKRTEDDRKFTDDGQLSFFEE